MVFSSEVFLFLFLPVTYLLYLAIPKLRARNILLIIVSLVFYAYGEPAAVLLMILSVICNYFFGRAMANERCKKPVLIVSVVFNVGMLFVFKYLTYTLSLVKTVFHAGFSVPDIALPIGISFFTFQAMSYVIDVYRGNAKVQKNLVTFSVYLSLFPQLVAGPIVRYTDLEEQLIAQPKPEFSETREGLRRFCTRLAKKVLLADTMGRLWGTVNGNFAEAGALGAWVGLLAFSFQIFFDFSGYSDMAIGLCRGMGFRIPENFLRPYRASSLTDFWRRWHMTLTDWFKAYVYIPLGGSRRGRVRRDLNVLVVWALTGLWHGAGWNFVLWGLYFAVLLIFEKRFLLQNARWVKIPEWIRRGLTFFAVMLGWGLFSGFGSELWTALAGGYGGASARTLLTCAAYAPMLLLCAGISFLPEPKRVVLRRFAAPVLMILCLAALAAQGYAPFVYFQF